MFTMFKNMTTCTGVTHIKKSQKNLRHSNRGRHSNHGSKCFADYRRVNKDVRQLMTWIRNVRGLYAISGTEQRQQTGGGNLGLIRSERWQLADGCCWNAAFSGTHSSWKRRSLMDAIVSRRQQPCELFFLRGGTVGIRHPSMSVDRGLPCMLV